MDYDYKIYSFKVIRMDVDVYLALFSIDTLNMALSTRLIY